MAADPRDLCTLTDVRSLMQKSGQNQSSQDSLIGSLITRASVKIMRDYAREFAPGGPNAETFTNATRTFEFEKDLLPGGEVFVDLSPYDLATSPAPTVILDPDLPSPLTLDSTQWRLWPVPTQMGVYSAIRVSLISARTGWPRFTHRQLSLQGNWGFPSVPFDVTQACAETVVHWITSYPGARRVDQVDSGMPGMTPRSYPMSAIDLLHNFKRVVA